MILSLDASTKATGYAIFNYNKKLITYGCLSANSTDVIKRINKIISELQQILLQYTIEQIILEEVRPENKLQNMRTHKVLMWLQGAIEIMVHNNFPNIKIEYIYPSEWRK